VIYEIILLQTTTMQVEYAYSLEGEIDKQKLLTQTGLASLIETAVSQLTGSGMAESEAIFSLKTGANAFSFKTFGEHVLVVRGSDEGENKKMIKKVIADLRSGEFNKLIERIKNSFNKDTLDEFSSLWG
jgi:hypothetical protein